VPVYKIFQHGSTMLGFIALSFWLLLWYRNTEPRPDAASRRVSPARRLTVMGVVAVVALIGAAIRATAALGIYAEHVSHTRFIGLVVVTLISLLWWQFVLYGVWRTKVQTGEERAT
jgi:hypothetical protein